MLGGQKIEASERHLSRQLGISIQRGIVSTRLQMGVWRESLCACMSARDRGLEELAAAARCRCPLLLCTLETRAGVGTTGTPG